jgi:propanol-preferring alcohol dehydrogenase
MEQRMRAVKITGKGKVEVLNVPVPKPGRSEVLIEMKASCLCRSDLYRYHGKVLFEGEGLGVNWTPGHEPCGVVKAVGECVTDVMPGDRVGVYMMNGCEKCEYCEQGYIMLCKDFGCIGFACDGAHADYLITTEKNCLPLPDDMDYVTGALLTDMGGTLYSACKSMNVNGAMTVAVFGLGPMGCAGILFAKQFGALTIGIDIDTKRLDFAQSIGADYVIDSTAVDVVDKIRELTFGKGADASIDCTGNPLAENNAINCLRNLGQLCVVGENDALTINPSVQLIRKRITIHSSWIFNRRDWGELCDFVQKNRINVSKIASHVFNIENAAEAFALFDSHQAQKVVFVWD